MDHGTSKTAFVLLAAGLALPAAGAQYSDDTHAPGRGGLPGVTGTAAPQQQRPGPDQAVPPVEGPARRTGPISDRTIREIKDSIKVGMPTAGTTDIRVFRRDGKVVVRGSVNDEREREEVMRRTEEILGEGRAVYELRIDPPGPRE